MGYRHAIIVAWIGLMALTGCGAVPASSIAPTTEAVAEEIATQVAEQGVAVAEEVATQIVAQGAALVDEAGLSVALEQAGATVVATEQAVEQAFLDVTGTLIQVNGADVQVYTYDTPEAAQAAAQQASDVLAGNAPTTINWTASPHFYQQGRLLVLYVGDDEAVLSLLESVLGAPVAEQTLPGR